MMNKRVYGVLGISSIMANWNADFSGYPKTTADGRVFGSDKALKFPIKKMWDNEGKKVVYIKSMKFHDDGKTIDLIPRTLKERYEQVFGIADLKQEADTKKVLTNLFKAIDVKNFGATFAEAECNLAITGAVQIGQGMNKYDETFANEQSILSPFRDATAKEKNKEKEKSKSKNEDNADVEGREAKNSTLGTKIVSDEAHYFYPFSVNPMAYKEYMELGVTEGYTEEDYKEFKRAALTAATAYSTNAKSGCDNEFAIFIETAPDTYIPNLDGYITFEKGAEGEKNVISLGEIPNILTKLGNQILSVEVYYNPYTTKLENADGIDCYDIVTKERV